MPENKRILIVGCGYLGEPLGIRLAAEGHVVFGLRRHPDDLPVSVHKVEGDVGVPNTLRRLPDIDEVVYLVAPADPMDEAARRAAFVDGPRYFLGALEALRRNVRRIYVGSCVAVYGDRAGEWVDEESALEAEPKDAHAAALRALEATFEEGNVPATVLRFGTLYGTGRLGLLGALLQQGPPVPAPRAHENLVHRDDAVAAICHLVAQKRPAPRYVVADREPVPRLEVLGWLADRMERPLPEIAGDGDAGGSDVRAMSERLVETGFHFRYPSFRKGYVPLLRGLRA